MSDKPSSPANAEADTTDEGYRVLARKYRPSSFEDLIGQQAMVRTLENAFASGRIAQAYMLTGVRGVGKTTTARILARALNYQTNAIDKPSLDLSSPGINCESIMDGSHVDVIEMDAASHTGIDDIREIIAAVRYKPVSARYKVYIIDEVHMLSKQAFNGLLKTLEEPPEHVKFIFATTEIRKVPITVLSRCQRFDLRRIEAGEMMELLKSIATKESVKVEDEALAMIARAGEGSARDALSLLDQAIAHAGKEANVQADEVRSMLGLADRGRVIDLFEHIMRGRIAEALDELKTQYDVGADPATVLTDLAEFVHFVTRVRYVKTALDDPALSQDQKTRGKEYAEQLSPRILGRAWQMLLKGIAEVQSSPRPLAAADMVLVRMTHAADLPTLDEALKQLSDAPSAPARPSGGGGAGGNGSGVTAQGGAATAIAPNGGATMRQANGPTLIASNPAADQKPTAGLQFEAVSSFDELLNVAEKKRDIRFKLLLRNNVSLVHFEKGRIELKPVGDAPRDLLNQISGRLKDWTGENWLVVFSEADGAATVKDQEAADHKMLLEDAEQDPTVAAVLRAFPKSKIVDVRFPGAVDGLDEAQAAEAALDNPDLDDEAGEIEGGQGADDGDPGAAGLDDYFNS